MIGSMSGREPVLSLAARRRQGYFNFATWARRGLRKGTYAVRGHDRDSGRDRDAADGLGAALPDGESAPLDRPDPVTAGQHGRAPGRCRDHRPQAAVRGRARLGPLPRAP